MTVTLGLLALAVALGIKHSFDADHLVAVSGLLTRSSSKRHTGFLSISWAIGHMFTASIITIILFTFRETLLKSLLDNLDFLVPVMLILIGIITLVMEFDLLHIHRHQHKNEGTEHSKEHTHFHPHIPWTGKHEHGAMAGIGLIHGIASNDELLLLFTLTLGFQELGAILLGVVFFTLGVVSGMLVYSLSINYPAQKWGRKRVTRVMNVSIATLSILYAGWLLFGYEGINIFEFLSTLF